MGTLVGMRIGRPPTRFQPEVTQPQKTAMARSPAVKVRKWEWPDVESPDYATLISNLRLVACPEDTINAIVRQRIEKRYKQLMLQNPMSRYWETADELKQRAESNARLREEMNTLLARLGFKVRNQTTTPKPSRFSPYQLEQITKINQEYPNKHLPEGATSEEYDESFKNRKARLDYLAQILTPDELSQYRLTQDSNIGSVTKLLQVINATPDEINKAAFIFDFEPAIMSNGSYSPGIEQALLAALGQERYDEFHAAFSPDNINFSQFIMAAGVSPDVIAQLKQLRQQQLDPAAMQAAVTDLLGPQMSRMYFQIVSASHP